MKNRLILTSLVMILAVIFLNSVNAEIIFSKVDSKYNIGDEFDIDIQIKKESNANSFLRVSLICESNSVEIYKSPLQVQPQKVQNVSIKAKLDRVLISDSDGECRIDAEYADETASSQSFTLSDVIKLDITLDSNAFNPSSNVNIVGTAKKFNNEKVNGFVHISLSGSNVSFLSNIDSNTFNYSFNIPQNHPAGLYSLNVKIYEKESSGAITNEGFFSEVIRINQIVESINISLSSYFVNPSENLTYSITLRDQSGKKIESDVNSIIYTSKSKDNIYSRRSVKSGELIVLEIPKNASAGDWAIEGFHSSLTVERNFNVREVSKASFYIQGEELVIENQGNVNYESKIYAYIGDKQVVQSVSLPVDGEKRYSINAPVGVYPLSISDSYGNEYDLGEIEITQSKSGFGLGFITGSAIGLRDLDARGNNFVLIFLIIIILVILYLSFYYFRKMRRKNTEPVNRIMNTKLAYKTLSNNQNADNTNNTNREIKEKKDFREYQNKPTNNFTPLYNTSLNSKENKKSFSKDESKREEVVVLALKIKNSQKLRQSDSSALAAINSMLHKARLLKAKIYDQGDIKLIVFSSSLSDKINALEAVKTAHNIDVEIKNFNKKYAIKIEYGLGMHVGEMFFEMLEGKPKFTSIGNITILPKNLASKANSELIITNELFRKVYTVVKSEQTDSGYRIISFKDNSNNQFIQRFMKKKEDL